MPASCHAVVGGRLPVGNHVVVHWNLCVFIIMACCVLDVRGLVVRRTRRDVGGRINDAWACMTFMILMFRQSVRLAKLFVIRVASPAVLGFVYALHSEWCLL